MREFDTGATRSNSDNKLDYEGFIHPEVEYEFAEYMHKHRVQSDGNLRASDNWQKGIPVTEYRKCLARHNFDLWRLYRGGKPIDPDTGNPSTEIGLLCAIKFNINGLIYECIKKEDSREKKETNQGDIPQRTNNKWDEKPKETKYVEERNESCRRGYFVNQEGVRTDNPTSGLDVWVARQR